MTRLYNRYPWGKKIYQQRIFLTYPRVSPSRRLLKSSKAAYSSSKSLFLWGLSSRNSDYSNHVCPSLILSNLISPMAFLLHSPEIPTVSARIFSDSNTSVVCPAFMKRKVTISSLDARDLSGVKKIQKSRLYRRFSSPVKEDCEIKTKEEEEDKQSYYVNMGHAVRCLREEFPSLFYKEPNFEIYRDDIVFRDPINTFMGIDNYKSIFWALRFHGRIFFKALCVDVVSVWQPTEKTLMIRWTVHGIPRGPWETRGRFDGTSEYKFDKNGKIYEHKVDNIAINSPPKFQMVTVQELVEAISCPSTPKPTYFELGDSPLSY